jgi:hypothetical protein
VGLWLYKLRKLDGPNFTWPMMMFANALPKRVLSAAGKLYAPRPLAIKSRRRLLEAVKPAQRRFLREDNGDMPEIPATPPLAQPAPGVA